MSGQNLLLVAAGCAFLSLAAAVADHHNAVDLHRCDLCPCFVRYTDRDLWVPKLPYKAVENPRETSLDSCLRECIDDDECMAVVHGITGGRQYLTCEFYDELDPTGSPTYTPYVDVFAKRKSMPCMLDWQSYDRPTTTTDDEVLNLAGERKDRWQKVFSKRNPLFWGKRR